MVHRAGPGRRAISSATEAAMKPSITFVVLGLIGCVTLADGKPKPIPAKDQELRKELLVRTRTDQEAREVWSRWMTDNGPEAFNSASLSKEKRVEFERLTSKLNEIDAENTKWLKGVVERHGWPTNTLVGTDGADAAWLLVQHADADPKFQRRCLDLMTKLPKNEIPQTKLAYLTDRVLLAEGKKQKYGTQFTSTDGTWKPRPIEDEATVDKRRAEVGLGPLAEYAKKIEQQYGIPKK